MEATIARRASRVPSVELDGVGTDELHVWTVSFAAVAPLCELFERSLTASERDRVGQYATSELRERATITRGALRTILAGYLGVSPRQVPLTAKRCTACGAQHGKPALAWPADELRFNIAHTRTSLLVAVARGRELGIDAEPHAAAAAVASAGPTWLAPAEAKRLATGAGRERALLRLWMLKEAYLKAVGTGLNVDPRSVEIDVDERVVRHAPGEPRPSRWLLLPLELFDDVVASLVVERGEAERWSPQIVLRTLDERAHSLWLSAHAG